MGAGGDAGRAHPDPLEPPMTTEATYPTSLHVVRISAGCYILARQDASDQRRWYAPAGGWCEATGRLAELPGMNGVTVYRTRKAAQAVLDYQY